MPGALVEASFLTEAQRGVAADRHPEQPLALGLSVVRLRALEGPCIRFEGADMQDGTPLVGLTPFDLHANPPEGTSGGWRDAWDCPKAPTPGPHMNAMANWPSQPLD
jgi:tRNA (Thr-GGU) A37 N-methylase